MISRLLKGLIAACRPGHHSPQSKRNYTNSSTENLETVGPFLRQQQQNIGSRNSERQTRIDKRPLRVNDPSHPPVKLRHIAIRNYKGLDSLDLEFPGPQMPGDPDVLVFGSENGLGKTSVLECCALLLLVVTLDKDELRVFRWLDRIDIPDLVIRAGQEFAEISGVFDVGKERDNVTLELHRDGTVKIPKHTIRSRLPEMKYWNRRGEAEESLRGIWGFTADPVLDCAFLFFHSYRKIPEGNPDLGLMVEREGFRTRGSLRDESRINVFKVQMLRALMSKAELFELDRAREGEQAESIEKLNELLREYAGGTITKLRPSPDNSVDFRVDPLNGGIPYTYDGLSSGQKEIISTLFLIWYHTKNRPMVVLIDEPELHLNAQWHRKFTRSLFSLAPENQYIMATHSQFVMDSVDEDRRIILSVEPGVVG